MIKPISPDPISSRVCGEGMGALDRRVSPGVVSGSVNGSGVDMSSKTEASGLLAMIVTAKKINKREKTATLFIFGPYPTRMSVSFYHLSETPSPNRFKK